MTDYFGQKKLSQLFGVSISKTALFNAEQAQQIDQGERCKLGAISSRRWPMTAVPKMGEIWGTFSKFHRPLSVAVFTTKGGVLKTTLALNLARYAALHNLKVCVVGLDMQGDITTALGHQSHLEDGDNLEEMIKSLNETKGLADIYSKNELLSDVILPTEIPTLFYIPETPELAAFNEHLTHANRREYWLKEKVIEPLKQYFDLIVMDCSPNWNKLITNALVACDVLLSPLECKINNFRNFKVFEHFLGEFKKEMKLHFDSVFIPTKYTVGRKLSMEIRARYQGKLPGCTKCGIRESVVSEEACASKVSVPEYALAQIMGDEMRMLLKEIHDRMLAQSLQPQSYVGNHPWPSV